MNTIYVLDINLHIYVQETTFHNFKCEAHFHSWANSVKEALLGMCVNVCKVPPCLR